MTSPTPTDFPDGYRAPLAPIDGDHRGAGIHICNGFGLTVVLITLLVRVYIRTRVAPPWSFDDHASLIATMLGIIQSALTFAEVHSGFGTSIDLLSPDQVESMQKIGYAAGIFYILTIFAGKISLALLFKRISADRTHQVVAWSILAVCFVMGLISVFLVAIRCDVSQPWSQHGESCPALFSQLSTVAAFDVITEVALFLVSILLVHGLHTKAKNKGRVVLAFGIRLPIIAVIILQVVYLRKGIKSPNPTLDGATAVTLTLVEMFYNIMTATVPCLRPFIAGFATNFGAIGSGTVLAGSQIGTGSHRDKSGSKSGSYALSSFNSKNRLSALREKIMPSSQTSMNRDTTTDIQEDDTWQPNIVGTETSVTRGSGLLPEVERSSVGSDESTKMIIKKEVQLTVGSEANPAPQYLNPQSPKRTSEGQSSRS